MDSSFKVTEMDIETGGSINLCFDYLSDNATFYVDDVIICKLSEYGITNGDFSYGVIGWRNWYDSQNFTISSLRKGSGTLVNCAHYITASTYGSVACNVDQIIANYGYITYQIDFDMYLPSDAHNILQDIKFYLTGGADTYHIYLGSKTQSQMVSGGWTHVSITFDSSENNGDVPYMAVLEPHYEEVFFRIQFDSKYSAGTNADEEYYLTNFEFKPQKSSNYVSSTSVVLSKTSLQLATGASYQLSAYVLPTNSTYKGIQWVSDSGAVIVSNDGLVTAVGKHGSTGTITAYSEDGTSLARCYVTVNGKMSKYLQNEFGFSLDTASKIESLYNTILQNYSSGINGDYVFSRCLSNFYYNGIEWNAIAGNVYKNDTEENYLSQLIGNQEYKKLRYEVRLQHLMSSDPDSYSIDRTSEEFATYKQTYMVAMGLTYISDSDFENAWQNRYNSYTYKADFAHQMYTISALIVENSSFNNTIVNTENRTIIAGWYGDAVIGLSGIPTFGADDYMADLDSENIVHIMSTYGESLKETICEYYYDIELENISRCEEFLAHTPLAVVESKIREKFNVSENSDLLDLDDNEGVAAYNFILNLQNMNEEMVYYF